MIPCYSCDGAKEVLVMVRGHTSRIIPCSTCKGRGEISEEQQEDYELGTIIKEYRKSLNMSQLEMSNAIEMDRVAYSKCEHGIQRFTMRQLISLFDYLQQRSMEHD